MKTLSSLSVVFPAYNDEKTIPELVKKANKFLLTITADYEIIVVSDGSTDNTAKILATLQRRIPSLFVITHATNKGYGAALISGFKKASKEFIFYTDGDGQYDVDELKKLVASFDDSVDMITGFKLKRSDPWFRKVVGALYNQSVKLVFKLHIRDVDCDFRLFKRSILRGVTFRIKSGAFDVEFVKMLQGRGVRFKEVPVHHYPRKYGSSQSFTLSHVARSLWDVASLFVFRR